MVKKVKQKELSDLIFRPISRPISSLLSKTKITPNQITIFSFLVGILASYFIFKNLIIAGILIIVFIILDNIDGEIARAKNLTSKLGHWLDFVTGLIVSELLILAIVFSIFKESSVLLGFFAALAFPIQFAIIFFYKVEITKTNESIEIKSAGKLNKLKYLYGLTFLQLAVAFGCFFDKLIFVLGFFAVFGTLFWIGCIALEYLNLK